MKLKKIFLSIICLLSLLMFGFSNVKAAEQTINTSNDVQILGASIRTTGVTGIRFVGEVKKDTTLKNIKSYGVCLGLGVNSNEELTIDKYFNGKEVVYDETTGLNNDGQFALTLINVTEHIFTKKISARAFVRTNDGKIVYGTKTISRSILECSVNEAQNGRHPELVNSVIKNVDNNCFRVTKTTDGYQINKGISYSLNDLEKEFINDWNTLFGTELTDINENAKLFRDSAKTGVVKNTENFDVALESNLRKFYNANEGKWQWLFDFLKTNGGAHPLAQIHSLTSADGIAHLYVGTEDEKATNLYNFDHLCTSIINFFKKGEFDPFNRNPGVQKYTDPTKYDRLVEFNELFHDVNSNEFLKKGDTITLEAFENKPGYKNSYLVNDTKYDENANYVIDGPATIKQHQDLITYNVIFKNADGTLIEGVDPVTYTIKDSNIIPDLNVKGFMGWYLNKDFTGEQVTKTPLNVAKDIEVFAKVDDTKTKVVLDYNNKQTKENILNELIQDVLTLSGRTKFLSQGADHSYGDDYMAIKNICYNDELRKQFNDKWNWLVNILADSILNGDNPSAYERGVHSKRVREMFDISTEKPIDQAMYMFTQSLKGYRDNKLYQEDGKLLYNFEVDSKGYKQKIENETHTIETLFLTSNESLTIEPVRYGHIFEGWFDKLDGGNKVTTIPNTNNANIYAHWSTIESYKQAIANSNTALKTQFTQMGVLSQSITLPLTNDVEGTKLQYVSSNQDVLKNDGKFIMPTQDTKLTLIVTISKGKMSEVFTYEFNAKGYKPLTNHNIASGYFWNSFKYTPDESFEALDIINCVVTADGVNGEFTNTELLNSFKTYVIDKAHKRGDYVLLTVEQSSKFAEFANPNNNKLEGFVNEIVKTINTYGFDGVDIDWEFPKSGQEQWFTNLIKLVNEKVKKNNPNHLVTAAIAGGMWQPAHYDLLNSSQYLDYINVMCYDMSSVNGQYQNALHPRKTYLDTEFNVGATLVSCSIEESANIYKDTYNVPFSKLVVGVPFYGRYQKFEVPKNKTQEEWVAKGAISYNNLLKSYLNNEAFEQVFDDVCKVPYLINKTTKEFISYENEESIKFKCEFIKTNKLAGIMYWANNHDSSNTLLRAINTNMKVTQ